MQEIKCVRCGRFISYEDIGLHNAVGRFTPDNEFGGERIEYLCFNCRADPHLVRCKMNAGIPDESFEIWLHDNGAVSCIVSDQLRYALAVHAHRYDDKHATCVVVTRNGY
jgi:hypothetical protein